ncbi:hypothetical protein B0T10DRAFT_611558 [Thelonectria olida]|uniref:Uncharacterized protein n=1 Tax=Thelonectria olida TaxID=1576542 RepID=A0A9P8VR97_9HYPO|nr:hypothetical protein B0T10DRAFT_611558 [Thelonectria olida]
MTGVLINGIGNFAGRFPRERCYTSVEKTQRGSSVIVMTSDFVPATPYHVSHIGIGIGQRHHLILNAEPENTLDFPADQDGNY